MGGQNVKIPNLPCSSQRAWGHGKPLAPISRGLEGSERCPVSPMAVLLQETSVGERPSEPPWFLMCTAQFFCPNIPQKIFITMNTGDMLQSQRPGLDLGPMPDPSLGMKQGKARLPEEIQREREKKTLFSGFLCLKREQDPRRWLLTSVEKRAETCLMCPGPGCAAPPPGSVPLM